MTMRIATYSQVSYNTQQNMRLSVEYGRTNQQISSGLKSENFGGVAKDAQTIIKMDSEISRTQTYINNLSVAETELETMYDALGALIEEINILVNDVSAAISGNLLQPTELQNSAEAAYDSTIAAINTQFQGRFLFGGANTGNPPVDVNDPTYPTPFFPASVANTNYYQGDNTVLSVAADENYVIPYGIQGNNPAFEQLLRGINILINDPVTAAARDAAMDLFNSGLDGLTNIQHDVSVDAQKVSSVKSNQEFAKTEMENTVAGLRDTDIAAASTELAAIETQLEASYSTTGKLLNLTILDFLR